LTIQNLTKSEEWLLEEMVIQHLKDKDSGALIWSPDNVADRISPIFTEELSTDKEINETLMKLISYTYAKPYEIDYQKVQCIVEPNGVLAVKRSLIPLAKKVNDKKSFNRIIDNSIGNNEVKKELKSLGDEIRKKAEFEIIESLLRFLIRQGSDVIPYIVNLLND